VDYPGDFQGWFRGLSSPQGELDQCQVVDCGSGLYVDIA
jgi:hypothetical protein